MPDDNMPDEFTEEEKAELDELDNGPDNFEGDPSDNPEIIVPEYPDPQEEARWVNLARAMRGWLGSDRARMTAMRKAVARWALKNLTPERGKTATALTRLAAVHDTVLSISMENRPGIVVTGRGDIEPEVERMVRSAPGAYGYEGFLQLRRFRDAVLADDKPYGWFPFDLDEAEQTMVHLVEAFEGPLRGGSLFGVN